MSRYHPPMATRVILGIKSQRNADLFTFPYPVTVFIPSLSNVEDLNYRSVTGCSDSVKATLCYNRFTRFDHLILSIFPFADSKHVSAGLKQTRLILSPRHDYGSTHWLHSITPRPPAGDYCTATTLEQLKRY